MRNTTFKIVVGGATPGLDQAREAVMRAIQRQGMLANTTVINSVGLMAAVPGLSMLPVLGAAIGGAAAGVVAASRRPVDSAPVSGVVCVTVTGQHEGRADSDHARVDILPADTIADVEGLTIVARFGGHLSDTQADLIMTRLRHVLERLEVLGRLQDWAGDDVQALAWYQSQPIPALGGRTAETLVNDGRADDLHAYLDHVAAGGFA